MARSARKQAVAVKPWTFMVYMAGNNNLEDAGEDDLLEMKRIGSTDGVHVVAQFDRSGATGSTRYYLKQGTSLRADAVQQLGVRNTGDPAVLRDFIAWGVSNHPAERYALVLWNHGQGWDDTDIYAGERRGLSAPRPKRIRRALFRTSVEAAAKLTRKPGETSRAILLDDGAKDFLDNLEMKKVLSSARRLIKHKIDLLGMDACLMNMGEVGYQLRGSVDHLVGSEETEPGDGWPYDAILRGLASKPQQTPLALGELIVSEYLRSYRGGREAVTQSLSDLGRGPQLAAAVKKLATALRKALATRAGWLAILEARQRAQAYEVRENVDLTDLCRLLSDAKGLPTAAKQACAGVLTALSGKTPYIVQSGFIGAPVANSNGTAIYFPTNSISPLYAGLDFAKATGWGAFLEAFVAAGQRR
jgi:hypothetical protein